jgi:23S rRNA pseudouridine2605 synthase
VNDQNDSSMRINRYLALCGFGSRRAVEALVRGGAVKVDGAVVTDLACRIEEGHSVEVHGRPAKPPREHEYILFHKPAGYLCSATDPFGRPTIYDILPLEFRKLHYVGRLDFQSRGLIILTNDGALTHELLHPSREVPRTYKVWTKSPLDPVALEKLRDGVEIGSGEMAIPQSLRVMGDHCEIVLREGKNREIRRMLEVLGHKVVDLQRIRFGGLSLGDVPEAGFRRLDDSEAARLHGDKST